MKDWWKKIFPLVMLGAAFMGIEIFVGGLWGVAIPVVIVLHCTFYHDKHQPLEQKDVRRIPKC